MKHRKKIITASILVIFIGGFICGRLIKPFKPKDVVKTEMMIEKSDLQDEYKKIAQAYIDSANNEIFNFSLRYYHLTTDLLPDYYIESDKDTVHYNKKNFFNFYARYKIIEYSSNAKSALINSLWLELKDTTKTN